MRRRARTTSGGARLTPTDAAWYRLEHRGNSVDVTAVLSFDGELSEERLRARLEERLLVHPRFRRRVVAARRGIGRPRWEDDPRFSMGSHIRRAHAASPGGRAELETLVGALMSEPFDWSRSPWRVVLVSGLAEGTAMVAQVHHCIGDGFALMEILLSLADSEPASARAPHAASAWPLDRARLRDLPRLAIGSAMSLAHLARLSFDPPNALRAEPAGVRRASWSGAIPLSDLKARAHASGGTVNDVLLAAVTGALRAYFRERGAPLLPLRAFVPVDLRPSGAPIDLEHGNWFGLVYVDLPIDEPDRGARERALRESIDRLKRSMDAVVALGLLEVMGRAPVLVARGLEAIFVRKASLVITNVPGPRARLRLAGVPLREIVFWVPHPRLSVGVSLLSYAGEVRVGVRADVGAMRDPERLVALFEEELVSRSRARPSPDAERSP